MEVYILTSDNWLPATIDWPRSAYTPWAWVDVMSTQG
jgi:hypothetical protein